MQNATLRSQLYIMVNNQAYVSLCKNGALRDIDVINVFYGFIQVMFFTSFNVFSLFSTFLFKKKR